MQYTVFLEQNENVCRKTNWFILAMWYEFALGLYSWVSLNPSRVVTITEKDE